LGFAAGGAIQNLGAATITNSSFDQNQALGGSGNSSVGGAHSFAGAGRGGAIFQPFLYGGPGTLTASNLTFTNNLAKGGNGNSGDPHAGIGIGGAVDSEYGGSISITGCLFSGNKATGASGAQGLGGGAANVTGSATTLQNCVISNGTAAGGTGGDGGGVWNDGLSSDPTNAGATSTFRLIGDSITSNQAVAGTGGGVFDTAGGACASTTFISGNTPNDSNVPLPLPVCH
jgi:hypothetical protein